MMRGLRIVVSGSHGTGKSTLLQELARRYPDLTVIEEPYYRLLAAGHAFSDPPIVDDFEALFDDSLAALDGVNASFAAFDRSPADYLAYIAALRPNTALPALVSAAVAALATVNLVVYVPIETRDRIEDVEAPRLRRRVDALLREMWISRSWGFAPPVLEVHGASSQRANQVVDYLESLPLRD